MAGSLFVGRLPWAESWNGLAVCGGTRAAGTQDARGVLWRRAELFLQSGIARRRHRSSDVGSPAGRRDDGAAGLPKAGRGSSEERLGERGSNMGICLGGDRFVSADFLGSSCFTQFVSVQAGGGELDNR